MDVLVGRFWVVRVVDDSSLTQEIRDDSRPGTARWYCPRLSRGDANAKRCRGHHVLDVGVLVHGVGPRSSCHCRAQGVNEYWKYCEYRQSREYPRLPQRW